MDLCVSLYKNILNVFNDDRFQYQTIKPSEKPKAGFNYEQWKKVGEKLCDLFFMLGKKETIGKGSDRYDGVYVIVYNLDRPPYWLPVTSHEAFTLLIDY